MSKPIIRKIEDSETLKIAHLFARVFKNDVLFQWLCKTDFESALANAFEKLILNRNKMALEVFVYDDGAGAAIVRKSPGKIKAEFLTALSFLPDLVSIIGIGKIARLIQMELMTINRDFSVPHTYLWYLAIDENKQGQGLGKLIVNSLIEEFGTMKLQTSNPRNLKFYQDLGFAISKEISLGTNAPKIWQFAYKS